MAGVNKIVTRCRWMIVLMVALVAFQPSCARQLSRDARDQPTSDGSATSTEHSISVAGTERTFIVHVPSGVTTSKAPVPLVFILHGGFSSGERMIDLTGFSDLADANSFIVVYPQGKTRNWKDGREDWHFDPSTVNDVAFIEAIIDNLSSRYSIDQRRIYAAGMSNGSIMCNRLACELSDRIAAVATVAGPMGVAMAKRCRPADPISVLHFHGTADNLIRPEGGKIIDGRLPGAVLSVDQTLAFWANHNGCSTRRAMEDVEPTPNAQDGTRVRRESFPGCQNGTAVMLYTIENAGHSWPGEPETTGRTRMAGNVSRHLNASEIIWAFFRAHPKQA